MSETYREGVRSGRECVFPFDGPLLRSPASLTGTPPHPARTHPPVKEKVKPVRLRRPSELSSLLVPTQTESDWTVSLRWVAVPGVAHRWCGGRVYTRTDDGHPTWDIVKDRT